MDIIIAAFLTIKRKLYLTRVCLILSYTLSVKPLSVKSEFFFRQQKYLPINNECRRKLLLTKIFLSRKILTFLKFYKTCSGHSFSLKWHKNVDHIACNLTFDLR